jgi:hypothetical protein
LQRATIALAAVPGLGTLLAVRAPGSTDWAQIVPDLAAQAWWFEVYRGDARVANFTEFSKEERTQAAALGPTELQQRRQAFALLCRYDPSLHSARLLFGGLRTFGQGRATAWHPQLDEVEALAAAWQELHSFASAEALAGAVATDAPAPTVGPSPAGLVPPPQPDLAAQVAEARGTPPPDSVLAALAAARAEVGDLRRLVMACLLASGRIETACTVAAAHLARLGATAASTKRAEACRARAAQCLQFARAAAALRGIGP